MQSYSNQVTENLSEENFEKTLNTKKLQWFDHVSIVFGTVLTSIKIVLNFFIMIKVFLKNHKFFLQICQQGLFQMFESFQLILRFLLVAIVNYFPRTLSVFFKLVLLKLEIELNKTLRTFSSEMSSVNGIGV